MCTLAKATMLLCKVQNILQYFDGSTLIRFKQMSLFSTWFYKYRRPMRKNLSRSGIRPEHFCDLFTHALKPLAFQSAPRNLVAFACIPRLFSLYQHAGWLYISHHSRAVHFESRVVMQSFENVMKMILCNISKFAFDYWLLRATLFVALFHPYYVTSYDKFN